MYGRRRGGSPLGDLWAAVTDTAHLQIPWHIDLFQPGETPAFLFAANEFSARHCQQEDKIS
jgi:hypothetical protein